MERRVELIGEWKDGESIVALAESCYGGVSRKTIYKWIDRHAAEGDGWVTRSQPRAALQPAAVERGDHRHGSSQRTAALGMGTAQTGRQTGAGGGRGEGAGGRAPSRELLRSKGLSHPRRRRVRTPLYGPPIAAVGRRPKPNLVRRFQSDGSAHRRRHALRSVNDHRCAQPLSAVLPDRGENRTPCMWRRCLIRRFANMDCPPRFRHR